MKPLPENQERLHVCLFRSLAAGLAAAAIVLSSSVRADDVGRHEQQTGTTQKVYLLDCPADESVWNLPPKDLHWKKLHQILDEKARLLIKVTDHAGVDQSLYLDIEGLRLYVSSRECLKTLKQLPQERSKRITSAYLIRNLLGRRYAETGVAPDRIPVNGQAGRKRGAEGMRVVLASRLGSKRRCRDKS